MMNNKNNNMPTHLRVNSLIEKYFEGLTSLEEEQQLRDYFQQETIDEELEIYRPMFQYFADSRGEGQKAKGKGGVSFALRPSPFALRLFGVAAACLLVFLGVRFINTQKSLAETSTAYINGKKYTNIEVIQTEALKALENISDGDEDMVSSQIEALDFFLNNN